MDVSVQNTDKTSALLTVTLVKTDYREKVDKSLRQLRQKVQMPGFRPGMVPMGLVKKRYGKSVAEEEVNKIVSEAVNKHIGENHLNILGEPLLHGDVAPQFDFDTAEKVEYQFDIALAPEINVSVSRADKVPFYTTEVTDDMVEDQVKMYTQRNGSYGQVESYQDNDMLKGTLCELAEDGAPQAEGIRVEGAVMMPGYMKDEAQKALFASVKKGDTVVFNPRAAWQGNAAELASLLKIDKEAAEKVQADFQYQVDEITRYMPGELNQELFDQVFGKDSVKTPEEFRSRIKSGLAARFMSESDYKFFKDIRALLMQKAGEPEYNEALLKRIMRRNNPDKDDSFVQENYAKSVEELTWHLVKEQLVKANQVKVEEADLTAMAKEATRVQFAEYGMMNVPDKLIEQYAGKMMEKKENVEGLIDRVIDNKLTAVLKPQVTLEPKTLSAEEFNKLFQ
ncbi:MAG: trigger factor [Prevotellaceae bacterium]|nr:trigger factor [Prevotellaceae bacterium]